LGGVLFVVAVAVSALLAALLATAAIRKLSHRPVVVESYLRVGVPEKRLNQLAVILLAGAAGVLLGLWWAPLQVAATAGLICYFVVAIGFHLRAGDARNAPTPFAFAVLAAAALLLRLATW
jgi:hypothetical protein